ncbi:hypothetical protein Tther_01380 [Tepidimonas thermarum]|uniref:Terminase-like family protein n=1 Tax=Tepidimonas thermarum TaxID=335431 RepID=A0A554X1D1_9BURK|nr:hypothetical protein [Tepidimonas thermarum]TSE29644.1 hypothetical protein Tther_01380 [Tepidimonas thermarum]
MPQLTLSDFTPHAGQRRILRAASKRNVCCMGRRWGKTEMLKEVIVAYPGGALGGKDGRGRKGLPCAWYAPNDSYFSRVFFELVEQYQPVIRKASTQPRPVIEFINGGRIDFWTLADLDGDAWFISTPNGINYFAIAMGATACVLMRAAARPRRRSRRCRGGAATGANTRP